jgi:hypothetical protein
MSFQLIFPSMISSHAALGGEPRLGRVTQPGFRNSTFPRLSFRGTCVCPCKRTSTSSGGRPGGMCWRRNFKPPRTRSTTSGHSKLESQFPRTKVTRGPIARSSSRMVSAQTSPRCQISSASFAIWLTFSGKRLCVSAKTKMRNASFVFSRLIIPSKAPCQRFGQHRCQSAHARIPPCSQVQIAIGATFPSQTREDQLWVKVAVSLIGAFIVMEAGLFVPE